MTQGVIIQKEEREEMCAKIVAYLSEAYGRTMYAACAYAGVSQTEAYTWRDEDPTFDNAVTKARKIGRENAKDKAESIIMLALNNKSVKTAKWFLERAAKDRDYSARTEHTGPGGTPLHPTGPALAEATDEDAQRVWSEDARAAPDAP